MDKIALPGVDEKYYNLLSQLREDIDDIHKEKYFTRVNYEDLRIQHFWLFLSGHASARLFYLILWHKSTPPNYYMSLRNMYVGNQKEIRIKKR